MNIYLIILRDGVHPNATDREIKNTNVKNAYYIENNAHISCILTMDPAVVYWDMLHVHADLRSNYKLYGAGYPVSQRLYRFYTEAVQAAVIFMLEHYKYYTRNDNANNIP